MHTIYIRILPDITELAGNCRFSLFDKITPLKVEFSVPERYASQIKKGTNLNFRIEGKLDAFSAKVYAVESTIDPNLHQFTARALYPNTNRALLQF